MIMTVAGARVGDATFAPCSPDLLARAHVDAVDDEPRCIFRAHLLYLPTYAARTDRYILASPLSHSPPPLPRHWRVGACVHTPRLISRANLRACIHWVSAVNASNHPPGNGQPLVATTIGGQVFIPFAVMTSSEAVRVCRLPEEPTAPSLLRCTIAPPPISALQFRASLYRFSSTTSPPPRSCFMILSWLCALLIDVWRDLEGYEGREVQFASQGFSLKEFFLGKRVLETEIEESTYPYLLWTRCMRLCKKGKRKKKERKCIAAYRFVAIVDKCWPIMSKMLIVLGPRCEISSRVSSCS